MINKEWRVLGLGVMLDQLTKYMAQSHLTFYKPLAVFKGLSFQLVHNYGAAYGILQNQRLFLLTVSVVVMAVCFVWFNKIATTKWSRWGLVLLLIGTIGNFMDRVLLGYVIDFIDIRIFPVFNIADMAIDAGIFCFVCEMIFTKKRVTT